MNLITSRPPKMDFVTYKRTLREQKNAVRRYRQGTLVWPSNSVFIDVRTHTFYLNPGPNRQLYIAGKGTFNKTAHGTRII